MSAEGYNLHPHSVLVDQSSSLKARMACVLKTLNGMGLRELVRIYCNVLTTYTRLDSSPFRNSSRYHDMCRKRSDTLRPDVLFQPAEAHWIGSSQPIVRNGRPVFNGEGFHTFVMPSLTHGLLVSKINDCIVPLLEKRKWER